MDLKALKDTPPWDWPEGTGKMLLDILRDDQSAEPDRLLATELAGDFTVISDDLVDALLSILRSGHVSEKVRSKAAISLGPVLEHADTESFEDPDAIPIADRTFHRIHESLHKLYLDADVPKDVRRRILEASVRAPQDWHRDAVRVAYSNNDEAWRLTAVFCTRFVRGFDEQILEGLESTNPDIRYEAVLAAGNWEVDAAWQHVAALVTSKSTDAQTDGNSPWRHHEALRHRRGDTNACRGFVRAHERGRAEGARLADEDVGTDAQGRAR